MSGSAAEERYLGAHRAFAANGAGHAPGWLRDLRDAGIARFAELGFPTTGDEDWRLTSLDGLVGTPFEIPPLEESGAGSGADAVSRLLLPGGRGARLVFVDGRWRPALSSTAGLPAGATVSSLAAGLERDPERVRAILGGAPAARGALAELNSAFLEDGALVEVADGIRVSEPVQLVFLSRAGARPLMTHPRTLVSVGTGARVAVLETYAGDGDGAYWTNAVTDIRVADGGRADVYRVQHEGPGGYHTAWTHSGQGRDSEVHLHAVSFGAALSRHEMTPVLDGEGARCLLNGLYLADGSQHVDHHTVVEHAKPHGESREFFNGVLDGRARAVFNGRIVVRPGAQRTDSKQTNNNLLLSSAARADSQPQLEIYADDVKCTHGATLGPIDERALFYLESRGLGGEEGRAMLTYGFGAEILGRMEVPELRERLDAIVRQRLLGRGKRPAP